MLGALHLFALQIFRGPVTRVGGLCEGGVDVKGETFVVQD
jgi:hypothetical protein